MATTTQAGFELDGSATSLREMARSLWRSRELLSMLARKNFAVRYRRASIGMLWAVAMPLIQASMLALIFTKIVPIAVGGHNRGVFMYAGILPWSYFSSTVGASAGSIVDGKDVSTRVYFPRAVFPLVAVQSNLYGFAPGVVVLLAMAAVLEGLPGVDTLFLLAGIGLLVLLTAGFTMVFAALNVYFRDVRHLVAALLIPWFYATGIFFPVSRAPGSLRGVLQANPTVGVIQTFRTAVLGPDPGWTTALWWTLGWCGLLYLVAALLYRRFDRTFVDLM